MFFTEEFIHDYLRSTDRLSYFEKGMMLHLILTSRYPIIFSDSVSKEETIHGKTYQYISYANLRELYPRTISKRINMILENLTRLYPNFGEEMPLGKNENEFSTKISELIFFPKEASKRTANWNIFKMLINMGYVAVFDGISCTDKSSYYLTEKAWEQVDALNLSNDSKTIFIAMSFNDKNSSLHTAESIIKKAIKDCGYKPMIIKDKEHNEYIPAEIEYEIRCSAGMIADFTENKSGVYFEAGIARGMNKPVILTCHDNEKDKKEIHFDTKQLNTIFWKADTEKEQEDFKIKLKRRILRTVASGKNEP